MYLSKNWRNFFPNDAKEKAVEVTTSAGLNFMHHTLKPNMKLKPRYENIEIIASEIVIYTENNVIIVYHSLIKTDGSGYWTQWTVPAKFMVNGYN